MIVEMRIYTFRFGFLDQFLDHYRTKGRIIQWRILGRPIGYFSSESGELNELVHLWRYVSFEDRLERRRRLKADPGWQAFIITVAPMILAQNSRLLLDAEFEVEGHLPAVS